MKFITVYDFEHNIPLGTSRRVELRTSEITRIEHLGTGKEYPTVVRTQNGGYYFSKDAAEIVMTQSIGASNDEVLIVLRQLMGRIESLEKWVGKV